MVENYNKIILRVYNIAYTNIGKENIRRILKNLNDTKFTFTYLLEVLESNRYPIQIIKVAKKVGMFIPPMYRFGIHAFSYFINNIKYYEDVLIKDSKKSPTIYEIFYSQNRVKFLMGFRDDQLMLKEYSFSKRNINRLKFINEFIKNNITSKGEFRLLSNSRYMYKSNSKCIKYISNLGEQYFSVDDIIKHTNTTNKRIKNPIGGFFEELSLLTLFKRILEKFSFWKRRENDVNTAFPDNMSKLLTLLENILNKKFVLDKESYLGIMTLKED